MSARPGGVPEHPSERPSQRPRFKRFYHCEVLAPHGVLLLSERGRFLLRGRAYVLVAPFLDGAHTLEEIVARLDGQLPAAEVFYAVELLVQRGHVVMGGDPCPAPQSAFWDLLGVAPESVAERLSAATVSVHGLGGVDPAPFEDLLRGAGIRVAEDGDRWIVLVDDHLQSPLRDLDRRAAGLGRPWMLVKPTGAEIWLGPVFVPGKTGCWECLAHRLSGHRKAEGYVESLRGLPGPLVLSRAALPSTVHAALALAATEAARWVVEGASAALEGRIVTLDTATLERRVHPLTRRPQCASCGDPGLVAAAQRAPIALGPCPASFSAEGGHRRSSPEEMLARHEDLLSPITGIVAHLKRQLEKEGSPLTPSYVADHNFAHADEETFFLRDGQRSHSGGKGRSDAQARASALGEAVERYSGLFQGDEARLRARLVDLGGAGLHPNDHMLFSERQLAERERWNRSGERFTRVPAPFDPKEEIEWSPLFPLLGGPARYLPTACCYYGYSRRQPSPWAVAESNGCAAGATREEAVFQGLLELCERDATAVWWYNRIQRPGVDLESFGDPYYGELAAHYRTLHRELWALDLTHDLGIPTFAALSRRTDKPAEDIIFGLGAHLDPKIALLRAVTELNQFLPAVFFVTAKAEKYAWYGEGVRFFKTATIAGDPYLRPDPDAPPRRLDAFPALTTGDIHQDILRCGRILAEKGIEALVLDQTRPDAGLCVARVVAPGLRHFWARFAPGRLFDVPVRLGWRGRPLGEDELNPFAIFF
jgi:bacteriocin biosynthesis cyclodehydratase domain-containing protein